MPDDAHVEAWQQEVGRRIDSCVRLMHKLVNASWKWDGRRCRREDLEAVGMEALWRAAKFFEPERGWTFGTLAGLAIKRDLSHAIAVESKRRRWEVPFSVFSPRRMDWLRGGVERHENPLVEKAWEGPDPGEDAAVPETIALVERILSKLPPRQAYVLRKRWLEGAGLKEVGDELGVCKERVRQIELGALGWARRFLSIRKAGEAEVG